MERHVPPQRFNWLPRLLRQIVTAASKGHGCRPQQKRIASRFKGDHWFSRDCPIASRYAHQLDATAIVPITCGVGCLRRLGQYMIRLPLAH